MMTSVSEVHEDHQVFTFCGHIENDDVTKIRTGYVIAETTMSAINAMRECGFVITAITSLAEVRQTIQILEMIAHQHPEVERSEFLDVYPGSSSPYPEESVFCFSGHVVDASGALKSGFIVASGVQFVIDYLQGFGFVVESATSLADLRQTMAEMIQIAIDGPGVDHSCYVNFKE